MDTAILEIRDVRRHFGGVKAVDGVSLTVERGRRVALIGPNGAGKSTLANCVAGSARPSSGDVYFAGQQVTSHSAQSRARRGMARTFQNLELFQTMTVFENVQLALDGRSASRTRRPRSERLARDKVMSALDALGLLGYAHESIARLPYGVRKLVELSRAFVSEPTLLILDEPVAGLSDTERFLDSLEEGLDRLECAVLLIEHDMPTVRRLCEVVHVLDSGRLIASGAYADVARDERVIEAYLGSSEEGSA